jgi:hypothetical protein
VDGGQTTPIEDMLKHYEARDPSLRAKNDKLLSDNGLTRTTSMRWNFDVNLVVEPIPQGLPDVNPVPVRPTGPGDDDQQ